MKSLIDFWKDEYETKEPLKTLGSGQYAVYERIRTLFLDARPSGGPLTGSMLLYGPPGTGKTGIAEGLAAALGWRRENRAAHGLAATGPDGRVLPA